MLRLQTTFPLSIRNLGEDVRSGMAFAMLLCGVDRSFSLSKLSEQARANLRPVVKR
jgi:hypothetical protein